MKPDLTNTHLGASAGTSGRWLSALICTLWMPLAGAQTASEPAGVVESIKTEQDGGTAAEEIPSESSGEELTAIPVHPAAREAAEHGEPAETRRVGISIEEIVVTAQKRAESINSVPISVSAFSGDDLNTMGATDVQTMSRLVPGFNANENGGGSTIFTLRGVGFNDTTYTATGTVGIYVDEVNLPYSPMSRGPIVDVERLEVLKGPQGTLYGRNTTGGLINFIPRAPEDSFSAGGNVSYARFGTTDAEFFATGPLAESLRGRVAARVIRSDRGWQHSNTRPHDRLGEQNKLSARALMDWDASDSLTFRLDVEGWYNHGDSQAAQAIAVQAQNPFVGEAALSPSIRDYPYQPDTDDPQLADWVDDGGLGTKANDSFGLASIKSNWNIHGDLRLTAIGSIMRMRSDGTAILTTGTDVYNVDTSLDAQIRTRALEVRLSDLWWEGAFRWTAGVNLSRDEAYENRYLYFDTTSLFFPLVTLPPPAPPNAVSSHPVLNGEPTVKQGALFLNTDTDLSDTLRLTVGARYSKQNQRYYSCSYEDATSEGVGLNSLFMGVSVQTAAQYTATTGMPGRVAVIGRGPGQCFPINEDGGNDPVNAKLNERNLAGRVALGWQRTDDSLLYGSVGRGFKAGGFPVLNAANTSQFQPVKQEELLAFEAGIKHSFADSGLHVNFAGFFYDYKDKQLLTRYADMIFGPLPVLRNAPKSHVYGVELDAQATPVQGLYVAIAASYIKTKVDEFVSTNFTGAEQDFAGKPFNFSPEVQATAISDYSFPATARMNLGFGADVTYTGKTNGTLEQNKNYAMDAYTLFGARIHLDHVSGAWSLSLWGRNLTNDLATTGTFNLGDTVVRYVGMPRTFGIGLAFRYD